MQFQLDSKSMLAGTIAGAGLIAALGAVQQPQPSFGRFMIESSGAGNSRAYVLDSATGQVWESTSLGFHSSKLDAKE